MKKVEDGGDDNAVRDTRDGNHEKELNSTRCDESEGLREEWSENRSRPKTSHASDAENESKEVFNNFKSPNSSPETPKQLSEILLTKNSL